MGVKFHSIPYLIRPVLLGEAFLVLAERNVMAFVQRRKGPEVVGFVRWVDRQVN
jgi:NADH:ubiquinone oxidoreductase subunit H